MQAGFLPSEPAGKPTFVRNPPNFKAWSVLKEPFTFFVVLIFLFCIQFLKVIFYLQLLQNIGCIPCVVLQLIYTQ